MIAEPHPSRLSDEVDADPAQGQHDPAGAAEVGRRGKRAKSRLAAARPGSARPARPGGARTWWRRAPRRCASAAELKWTTNTLGPAPSLAAPAQLVRGRGLRPIVASDKACWSAEISERDRSIWVLSDPDVISNHGLAREGNAALAVALIKRLLGPNGSVVFDETHPRLRRAPVEPVPADVPLPVRRRHRQALIAILLLLWATMGRFGRRDRRRRR